MRPNEVSYKVIGVAMNVHTAVGPGLLESAYEKCLCRGFRKAGLQFERQVPVPVTYDGVQISPAFKADFVVERVVIVEIKCVDRLVPIHEAQLISYLRLTGLKLGLLLNFKVAHMRDGIVRKINAPAREL